MDEINYSIIIPHKNIPHLLQRCLKSIPRRKDVQIIIVDDNSDPEIVDFANFPGVLEECVEVYFTKEGKGAGFARNVGLEHAVGRWLIFADADDFFNACFLGSIDTYKDSLYDIVYFGVNSVFSDSLKVTNRDMRINKFVERAISLNDVNSLRFKLYGPVSKWYQESWLKQIVCILRNVLLQMIYGFLSHQVFMLRGLLQIELRYIV